VFSNREDKKMKREKKNFNVFNVKELGWELDPDEGEFRGLG